MTSNHEIVRTRGGVLAVRSVVDDEVMHPGIGPRLEAEQLYVRQSRLRERLAEDHPAPLVLFDVGLGAGSNAIAAWQAAQEIPTGRRLSLISFERDLGALDLALRHADDFGIDPASAIAARALLDHGEHDSGRVAWRLRAGDLLHALAVEPARADIVYWDPFSHRHNPGLWTVAAFSSLRERTAPGGTVFTYSASTATRVALLLAGFAVGVGDPTGDKAFTTAAATHATGLARPLDRAWLSRLSRPDVPLPPDAPADTVDRVAGLPQFQSKP
jgi:queuine tRNA-ribosyltransferase